ncbi:DUF475 domain-containing protein [bacterium]|nr:DUF475 domain-containing protein [bacterium]
MEFFSFILIIVGLALFEGISSVDNAIINADVLNTVSARAKRWFLTWGLFFGVFLVRGVLPFVILWLALPGVGPLEALTATWSTDEKTVSALEKAAPLLFGGGGTFLVFLFFHWLFMEPKKYGFPGEKFIHQNGIWFYAVASFLLSGLIWFGINENPYLAFSIAIGSSAFFLTHGFKQQAEKNEEELLHEKSNLADISKLAYLEVIDATFSIDGVLGAFAFTLSIPLILIGNGFGALVVRYFTIKNIELVKRYEYLKNGAMYSVLFLGIVMLAQAFGAHVPHYIAPLLTFGFIGYFWFKSHRALKLQA